MYKTIHQYYLYILTNKKNETLYIGVSNNLERRMFEHKNKLIEGFTKNYGLDKLVYFETYQYVNDAIKREKSMKKWKRQWKISLIEKDNPNWNDICLQIGLNSGFLPSQE
jgi:putative endonuclease